MNKMFRIYVALYFVFSLYIIHWITEVFLVYLGWQMTDRKR